MKNINKVMTLGVKGYAKVSLWTQKNATIFLFILGFGLLAGGLSEISTAQSGFGSNVSESWAKPNYNDVLIRGAIGQLFKLLEGSFGALIMVVAGLAAIVAAAMGAYRAAVSCLVVAVGAFILRSLVSLFFGQNYLGVADNTSNIANGSITLQNPGTGGVAN